MRKFGLIFIMLVTLTVFLPFSNVRAEQSNVLPGEVTESTRNLSGNTVENKSEDIAEHSDKLVNSHDAQIIMIPETRGISRREVETFGGILVALSALGFRIKEHLSEKRGD